MTGLRELKKTRTRQAVRLAAMRLFRDQGYEATTVEQIAADAEISTATFYRYYRDKEDVVINDGDRADFVEEVLAGSPGRESVFDTIRALFEWTAAELESDRDAVLVRLRLVSEVPALQARRWATPASAGRRAGQHARAAGGYQRGRSRAAAGHRGRPGGRVGDPVLLGSHWRYPVAGRPARRRPGQDRARLVGLVRPADPSAQHGQGKLSFSRAGRTSHPGPATSSRACPVAPTITVALACADRLWAGKPDYPTRKSAISE